MACSQFCRHIPVPALQHLLHEGLDKHEGKNSPSSALPAAQQSVLGVGRQAKFMSSRALEQWDQQEAGKDLGHCSHEKHKAPFPVRAHAELSPRWGSCRTSSDCTTFDELLRGDRAKPALLSLLGGLSSKKFLLCISHTPVTPGSCEITCLHLAWLQGFCSLVFGGLESGYPD